MVEDSMDLVVATVLPQNVPQENQICMQAVSITLKL
jgi:hypothetical protein